MTTTEQQARQAAEEIQQAIELDVRMLEDTEAWVRIITRNVQSAEPTITDAITEVERLRDENREKRKAWQFDEYYYRYKEDLVIITRLGALQGKAGVGDCRPK